MKNNKWAGLLAYVTGMVNQQLLLQSEYLIAENRILRARLPTRLRLEVGVSLEIHRAQLLCNYFSKDLQLFLKFCWLLGTTRPPAQKAGAYPTSVPNEFVRKTGRRLQEIELSQTIKLGKLRTHESARMEFWRSTECLRSSA